MIGCVPFHVSPCVVCVPFVGACLIVFIAFISPPLASMCASLWVVSLDYEKANGSRLVPQDAERRQEQTRSEGPFLCLKRCD